MKKATMLMAATIASVAFCAVESKPSVDSVEVASGLFSRSLDMKGGHILGKSYKTADGTEFMRNGSPEFAFRVDGTMYAGWSSWKDVKVEKNEAKGGACTTTVTGISSDGKVGIELTYTTYPGLALVRKTLAIANKGEKDVAIEDVDVETFRLATLGCTNSRVMRHFGRYREEGSVYIGDWNDPLVVVHDYNRRCGIAVGNEGVSTMKRTTAFQDGSYIVSGTPHVGERYPFRKWLKPSERWTAMPVFTAPYSKCPDPSRVVENAVSDYVRKYMGVRVEAIQKKPMFVYNTWVPFLTHIDAKLIRELADAAAECGIEEFVIDDGWQINISDGKYGRGDWAVDEKKFPGGLKPVFDYIKSKGMRPGLWLSLAWADPASAPMKEHPEWFVKDKAGNLSNLHTMRGTSRTACMATPWREYIRDKILGLVRDHGLAYVKLDLAIATSAYVYDDVRTGCYAKDHPGHRGHEDSYAEIYESCMKLFDELHEAAPDLFIDCTFETAGKTFLMDYGIAKHAEGNWLSNIASSEDGRLYVRSLAWGRTPALPATSLVIGNLHMNGSNHLLSFKSLAGTLPIMLGDTRKLTPAERAEYKEWSGWLKGLETRHGIMSFRQDLPGFGEPQEGAWDGFARVNTETKSGGLVGVFRHNAVERSRRVAVRGLDPDAKYVVLKGAKGERVAEMTGRELEEVGFEVVLSERCDGELFEIARVSSEKKMLIHSHNDYAQKRPFWGAYEAGADSIEADIFLVDGDLLVAHSRKELKKENTLRRLYLEPLREVIRKNGGRAYADGKPLQLLIDLKNGKPALDRLVEMIEKEGYRDCFAIAKNPCAAMLTVTGDHSEITDFFAYPDYVFFDVPPTKKLADEQYKRVPLISHYARAYTKWRSGEMPEADKEKIRDAVREAHAKGCKFRLWGYPDNPEAWRLARELGLDYINTDRPAAASAFQRNQ